MSSNVEFLPHFFNRGLIFHVMASLAQFESSLISERVKGYGQGKSAGKADIQTQTTHNQTAPDPGTSKNRIVNESDQYLVWSCLRNSVLLSG